MVKSKVFHILGNREIQANVDKQFLVSSTVNGKMYTRITQYDFYLSTDSLDICSDMVHVTNLISCFLYQSMNVNITH